MAEFTKITRAQLIPFLVNQGFQEIKLEGVKETVMGKIVKKNLCLRVYTSLVGTEVRKSGADAIRVCLLKRDSQTNKICPVGKSKRVHRVKGWMKNLQNRIDSWHDSLGPRCPRCGSETIERKGPNGKFYGCTQYRSTGCNGSQKI